MTKAQRTQRLRLLHDQLLRRFESDQSEVARRLHEEEHRLDALVKSQAEADLSSQEPGQLAWQVAAWSTYRQRIQSEVTEQSQVRAHWEGNLEEAKARTLLAYQDAKRWERFAQSVSEAENVQREKSNQRAADELAVTRHSPVRSFDSKGVDAT